jgi:hypothetical protein
MLPCAHVNRRLSLLLAVVALIAPAPTATIRINFNFPGRRRTPPPTEAPARTDPDSAAGLQQVHIPIQIPATTGLPAYAVDLVVMAPPGIQVRPGAPPQHSPDVAATIQHHQQHAQHVHQVHQQVQVLQQVQHRRVHHVCPAHHQPTPGQLAIQTMLQIASQQCNQMQYSNPSAPFHWPDRVLVCPHEPDEAGNNMQVLMLHRHQVNARLNK